MTRGTRLDRWRRRTPFLLLTGLASAGAGVSFGLRAVALGFGERSAVTLLVGGVALAAGYVSFRRSLSIRFDAAFWGSVAVVAVTTLLVLFVVPFTPAVLPPLAGP